VLLLMLEVYPFAAALARLVLLLCFLCCCCYTPFAPAAVLDLLLWGSFRVVCYIA
jgi:hypothetical protein